MSAVVQRKGGLVFATKTQDYSQEANVGSKNVDSSHFAPPFLNVAQDLSKLVKSGAAKRGDFFISSTGEVFPGEQGVTLLVCGTERYYTEWKPNNGGFVGRHDVTSPVVREAQAKSKDKYKLQNGVNNLFETFQIYALLVREDGSVAHVVMPFASTKVGPYKKSLVPMVFGIPLRDETGGVLRSESGETLYYPPFAHVIHIKTSLEHKNNNDYYNVVISYANGTAEKSRLDRDSDLYNAAKTWAQQIESGQVQASSNTDDDIPF